MEGKDYLVALNHCEKIGPSRLMRLRAYFNDWKPVWQAAQRDLRAAGLTADVASELISFRRSFDYEACHKILIQHNIKTVSCDEAAYPSLLQHIHCPPPLLYYRGSIEVLNHYAVAIVGTRKVTRYGKQVALELAGDLVKAGLTVVSGLALGIDTLAHEAALQAQGTTVAVLGSGLDIIYPTANFQLARNIEETGCLISEFNPGTTPFKGNFPQRNRIIAGLTLGTIVIEAGEKSGALITARHALQENREVMAVPGSIYTPTSFGPNELIKNGARVITSVADVLAALNLETAPIPDSRKKEVQDETERCIMQQLSREPKHINELAYAAKLDMNTINSRLTTMEINGLVKNVGNMNYIRLC